MTWPSPLRRACPSGCHFRRLPIRATASSTTTNWSGGSGPCSPTDRGHSSCWANRSAGRSPRCPVGLVGVVLAATFAASPAPSYLGWVQRYSLRSLFARRPPTLLVRYFVAGLDAPESLLACLRRVRRTTAGWVIAERLREVMREDARPALRAVPTPILYLLADRDRTVRPRSLRTILQERPDTVVHRLPSAHCVLQRQPVQAVEAIRSFLETCPGPLPVGARPRLPYRSPAESKY
jgi:pimeloyl-ACP methyl ester carboxylesterase